MACFVRRAAWTYDQPLFRRAASDEDELEAMLAAIARPDEDLWVVERDQRPAAFAWAVLGDRRVDLRRLVVDESSSPARLLAELLGRIEREYALVGHSLRVRAEAVEGLSPEDLLAGGFRRAGNHWVKTLQAPPPSR